MKKINKFLLFGCFGAISLVSCKKDTVTVTNTVFVTDNSTMGLLTQKQWIEDSAYNNYTGPGTGTLIYARGAVGNAQNLDALRSIFWPDGSAEFFDLSGHYNADSWTITAGTDSTAIIIVQQSNPTIHGKIVKLDATHLNIMDSTNSTLNVEIYHP
jgi:hypothetical protein